ncbi:hypothetical protein CROQUDRAFT_99155 [Cronartium quercuum f. sp. fusiforme G11]|uniref:Uncharacterized protein n=1 Tax=Cronartium quercuum f. sp. fusiforme G11 TaxID=708437 RepID=A0A9P6NBB8_9BASI|nr:hypothetical protein CROQUDRAFT_99155 [Cronartium quercuum f. sp. fusiforme G11]
MQILALEESPDAGTLREQNAEAILQALEMIESDVGSDGGKREPECTEEKILAASMADEWYPFKKKEHLVALLLIGMTQSVLSCAQYHDI